MYVCQEVVVTSSKTICHYVLLVRHDTDFMVVVTAITITTVRGGHDRSITQPVVFRALLHVLRICSNTTATHLRCFLIELRTMVILR